jgi:hypothetical protein
MIGTCHRFGETCTLFCRLGVMDLRVAGEGRMYRCRQERLGTGLWASSVEALTCKGE